MIINDKQAAIARREIEEILELSGRTTGDANAALGARAAELQEELDRYSDLTSGVVRSFSFQTLAELPNVLTEARIARNWTQSFLASRVGVSEQMVQKDEAGAYGRASLARLITVAIALNLHVTGTARLVYSGDDVVNPLADESVTQLSLDLLAKTVGDLKFLAAVAGNSISGYVEGLIDGQIESHIAVFSRQMLLQATALREEAESLEKQAESLASRSQASP